MSRIIKRIIVHATATPEGKWFDVDEIRKMHTMPEDRFKAGKYIGSFYKGKLYADRNLLPVEVRGSKGRGFSDIGYHKLFLLDGTVQLGRPIEKAGAHAMGYNSDSIGYSYVGGVDASGKAKDTRTPEQKEAMLKELEKDCEKYPIEEIAGHRDYSPDKDGDGVIEPNEWIKMCPCFPAINEYSHLIKRI